VPEAPQRHVFLSYRSLERQFALKLAATLRGAGVRVWVDCLTEGIRPGDDWPRSIQEALNGCRALIAVVSPDYVRSQTCLQELHQASALARAIFPVLLKPVAISERPLELARLQQVDFSVARTEDAFNAACARLVERLREGAAPAVGQQPDPEQRYLLNLIADLEGRTPVNRYVPLIAEVFHGEHDERDESDSRSLGAAASWGLDQEFLILPRAGGARSPFGEKGRPVKIDNLLEILSSSRQYALLGEPGAGKTTTLRRVALEAARARLDDPRHRPLPLLLKLPDWRREPDPITFIESHWPFDSDPLPAMTAGDVVVLMDGLNELGEQAEARSESIRHWLTSPKRPARFVVTCRARDYAGAVDLGIDTVTVSPMGAAQVDAFARAYLADDAPRFLDRMRDTSRAITRSDSFFLLSNPFLLTCLLILYRDSPNGVLPRNPGALFEQVLRRLWAREQLRGADPQSFTEASRAFAALAFDMIDRNQSTTIPRALAAEHLDERLVSTAIGAGIFELEGEDLRFYHQLIQECFAAMKVRDAGVLVVLGDDRARWSEVIVSLCGITTDVEGTVRAVLAEDPYLAGRCIVSGVDVSKDLRDDVYEKVRDEMMELQSRIIAREHERYPDMSSSSVHVMEDAVESSFGPYYGSLELFVENIPKARRAVAGH